MVFNTFQVADMNRPSEVQVYTVPLLASLLFLSANQIKFCLLGEGDLEEEQQNASLFDQRLTYSYRMQ